MKLGLLITCSLSLFLTLPVLAAGLESAKSAYDYANKGETDHALTLFDAALKSHDMDAATRTKTHYNKGTLLLRSGRPDLALDSFAKVLKDEPRHMDALINQSQALSMLAKPKEALNSAEKALEINKNHAEANYVRGVSLLALKQNAEAEKAFKQAVEEGDRAEYAVGLGRALIVQKKLKEAKAVLDKAIDKHPAHARAYLYRSIVYKGLGNRKKSDKDIVTAARYGYDDPVVRSVYLKRRFGTKPAFYTVTKKTDLLSAPKAQAPVVSSLPKDTFVEATACDKTQWCRAMFGRTFAGYIKKDVLKEVVFKP